MKNTVKILGYSILLVAVMLLYLLLVFLNIPFLLVHTYKNDKGRRNDYFYKWVYNTVFSIDQTGNATFYPIWNSLLVKDDLIYPFGNVDQTISHVLGWNRTYNNLTWFGRGLGLFLNLIFRKLINQTDHLEESK